MAGMACSNEILACAAKVPTNISMTKHGTSHKRHKAHEGLFTGSARAAGPTTRGRMSMMQAAARETYVVSGFSRTRSPLVSCVEAPFYGV